MEGKDLINLLPFADPYLFVDEITEFSEDHLIANYTFKQEEFFYKGHFPGRPITPGAILGEAAAQAALCLGIYLFRPEEKEEKVIIFLTSSELRFKGLVLPGEQILVYVDKMYFRFNKLKCKVKVTNAKGEMACRGTISGIVMPDQYE